MSTKGKGHPTASRDPEQAAPGTVPAQSPAKVRILRTASDLFISTGIRTVGVDRLIAESGVARATFFRHFPTKDDLLAAIMKRLLVQIVEEAGQRDLFAFFAHMVAQAAAKRAVVDLLAESGVDIRLRDAVGHLEAAVGRQLEEARAAGVVGARVRLPEVMALLTSVCQGALHGGWDEQLQARTLAVVFAGLLNATER